MKSQLTLNLINERALSGVNNSHVKYITMRLQYRAGIFRSNYLPLS